MKTLSIKSKLALLSIPALSIAAIQPSAQALTTTQGQATIIDFDNTGIGDGQAVTNQINGLSIRNGSIGYEGGARTGFRSNLGNDRINPNRLTAGAAFDDGFLTTQTFASSSNLRIDFDSPVSNLSFTVADIEGQERLAASVFDASGNRLGREVLIGNGIAQGNSDARNGSGILVSFNLDGISQLRLNPSKPSQPNAGIGYAIDNLAFAPAQAVPEPTSVAGLLAAGAFGAGLLRKRRSIG